MVQEGNGVRGGRRCSCGEKGCSWSPPISTRGSEDSWSRAPNCEDRGWGGVLAVEEFRGKKRRKGRRIKGS